MAIASAVFLKTKAVTNPATLKNVLHIRPLIAHAAPREAKSYFPCE
jgi:hypothetical protein